MTGVELVTLTVVRWFHLVGAALLIGVMVYHALILGFRVNKVSGPVSPLLKKMSRFFGPVYWAAIVLLVTTGGFTILDRLTSLEGRAIPYKNMYEFFWGMKILMVLVIIGNSLYLTTLLRRIGAAATAGSGNPGAPANPGPGGNVFRMRATVSSLRVFNLVVGIMVLMVAALLQNTFTLIVLRMEHYSGRAMEREDETKAATAGGDAPAPAAAPPPKGKRDRSWDLGPDRRGAWINGGLYGLYAVVSVYIALFMAEPNTVWFYVFYFLFFLALFQGFTVVARQCLHLTPKSAVRVAVVGKRIRLTRRNGDEVEITRDADYTRRKSILVLQGKTHDNQKVSDVIRKGALGDEAFEALVTALKRVR